MFPWFGSLGAKQDVATEMAKAKYEMFREAKSRLYYDVKSTWYNLYFTDKAIGIMEDNIQILNTFRKLALIKVESGLASTVDVLRVEMEIADLENQLALLKDNDFTMQTTFNNLLNVDQKRTVEIPDSLAGSDIGLSPEAIRDSIRGGNHQVLQLEFLEASYENQQIVAQKEGKPKFSIGFDYSVIGKSANAMAGGSGAGRDAFVFPMVGITIPLYREKYTSMVKEAALKQESAMNGRADRINILETTFEKANRDYRDAGRRIPLYNGQAQKATTALNILQTSYQTNGNNFEEVLRMDRQLLKYKLEQEKARADKQAAIAFINYLMGK